MGQQKIRTPTLLAWGMGLGYYNAITASSDGIHRAFDSETARDVNNFFDFPIVDVQSVLATPVSFLPDSVFGLVKIFVGFGFLAFGMWCSRLLGRALDNKREKADRSERLRRLQYQAEPERLADAERRRQMESERRTVEAERKRREELARKRQVEADAERRRQVEMERRTVEAERKRREELARKRQVEADAERRRQVEMERRVSRITGGTPFSSRLPTAVFGLQEEMSTIGFETIESLFEELFHVVGGTRTLTEVAAMFDLASSTEFHRGVMLRIAYATSLVLPKFEVPEFGDDLAGFGPAVNLSNAMKEHLVPVASYRDREGNELLDGERVREFICHGVVAALNSAFEDSSGGLARILSTVVEMYNGGYEYEGRATIQRAVCCAVLLMLLVALVNERAHVVLLDSLSGRRQILVGEQGHLAPHEVGQFISSRMSRLTHAEHTHLYRLLRDTWRD